MKAFDELMKIRGLGAPSESINVVGDDPVFSTTFPLGGWCADILLSIGVAVNDLFEMKTGNRQSLDINVAHAAAALRSFSYMSVTDADAKDQFAAQRGRQAISTPHLTQDGRYFLPHMGLPHLAERILDILKCDYELESVKKALLGWDALELENAVAEAQGCGAMVRTAEEWLSHPHGQALATRAVVEIEKIADSDPIPLPKGTRPLEGVRMLDLTRILAGPTCGRTLAEHGADVLMVTAEHLPQTQYFVMDTSHGKRTCFLDFNQLDDKAKLLALIDGADVFSQGYRPGVMEKHGLGPEELAARKPGIIYTSMNCYGYEGPFCERAGWEQLAQTVTGIAAEQGAQQPSLLPAAACDYSTGYLAAYGTLLALGRRAREGGSYHVKASLCQSGMFLNRQGRVQYDHEGMDVSAELLKEIEVRSMTPYGEIQHLGPVLKMSHTNPYWALPSSPLGSHAAEWSA